LEFGKLFEYSGYFHKLSIIEPESGSTLAVISFTSNPVIPLSVLCATSNAVCAASVHPCGEVPTNFPISENEIQSKAIPDPV
jgi:hypothetical protein